MKTRMLMVLGLALAGWAAGAAHAGQVSLTRLDAQAAMAAPRADRIALAGYFNPLEPPPKRPKDEEVPVPFGFFVGPMVQLLSMNMGNLDPMTSKRHLPSFSSQMYLVGMTGGVIHGNGRYGAFFLYGDQQRRRRVDNKVREAEITFQGGGLVAEYSREYRMPREKEFPNYIPYARLGWMVGAMGGMGQVSLSASGHDLGTLTEITTTSANAKSVLSSPRRDFSLTETTFIIYPYMGVWISPYDWLWLELDLGYLYFTFDATGSKVLAKNGKKMVDGPFPGGPQIGFKVLFGENPNVKVRVPE